jgi:Zinc finger, C3HC4 type (RING finger)
MSQEVQHNSTMHLSQDLSKAAEAADAAAAAWQCRICLGNTVDAAMQQCGHTLCRTCAYSVPGHCAFCRTPGGVLRIYNG